MIPSRQEGSISYLRARSYSFLTMQLDTITARADRLRRARIAAGFKSAREAWRELRKRGSDVAQSTYAANENGNGAFSFSRSQEYATVFGVRAEWLYSGSGSMKGNAAPGYCRIVGSVGANPDGAVILSLADERFDMAPAPPGAGETVVALEVHGHSMRGFADDGSLIYFEFQQSPPTEDMLGHVVILETEDGQVLVKRLLRGDRKGRYDLESIVGPTLQNQRLRWAAFPSAIVPPYYARRLIRRADEAAA